MHRKPGPTGVTADVPADGGPMQGLASPPSTEDLQLETLATEEYLAESKDGGLWYARVAVLGRWEFVTASDRTASRAAGWVARPVKLKLVEQVNLDDYELKCWRKVQAEDARQRQPKGGRIEQSFIIEEVILFILTWGQSAELSAGAKALTRAWAASTFLFDKLGGEEFSVGEDAEKKLIAQLLAWSFRRLFNLRKDWIMDLLADGGLRGFKALHHGGVPTGVVSPDRARLAQVQTFKYQMRNKETLKKLDEAIKQFNPGAAGKK